MAALTEDQKNKLNYTFGVDLDTIGDVNYSVMHQKNYSMGPIDIHIDGGGQIFSTEIGRTLICLVIHNGNKIIQQEGCQLEHGYGA